jgi:hypothetical protein
MPDVSAGAPAVSIDRFCPDCGYDLRGIASERCPECGLKRGQSLVESPIPWAHRDRIGRPRAFGRTVILATFTPKKLAAAAAVPVDYRDAALFRRIAVLLASLPLAAALIGVFIWQHGTTFLSLIEEPFRNPQPASPWLTEPALCWSAGAMLPPVLPLGIVLSLAMIAAAPSYWFNPRHIPLVRQNRAVAISAYLCAPLTLLTPTVLIGGAALALSKVERIADSPIFLVFALIYGVGALTALLLILLMCWSTLRVLSRTTHAGVGRLIAAGIVIPLSAALSVAIGMGVFPAVVGLIWLIIDSVR